MLLPSANSYSNSVKTILPGKGSALTKSSNGLIRTIAITLNPATRVFQWSRFYLGTPSFRETTIAHVYFVLPIYQRKSTLNIHWKDWCWSLKLQYFGHLMWRADSLEKILMLVKIEGKKRRGWQKLRWLTSPSQWTWIWGNSGRPWRIGKPGVLQSMGSQSCTGLSNLTTKTCQASTVLISLPGLSHSFLTISMWCIFNDYPHCIDEET